MKRNQKSSEPSCRRDLENIGVLIGHSRSSREPPTQSHALPKRIFTVDASTAMTILVATHWRVSAFPIINLELACVHQTPSAAGIATAEI